MNARIAMLFTALVPMTGCLAVVQGNGVEREEIRDVEGFSSIHLGHGLEAVATLGSPARVTVAGDANILPYVDARAAGGVLVIDAPDGTMLMPRVPLKITIVSPTLTGASASGEAKITAVASPADTFTAEASGDSRVSISGLSAQQLVASGSGLSRFTIAGTVRDVALHLSGGSSFDGQELPAQSIRLDGSGGSNGTVRATAAVTGELSGGSHFTVKGRPPMVQVELSGGSTVDVAD